MHTLAMPFPVLISNKSLSFVLLLLFQVNKIFFSSFSLKNFLSAFTYLFVCVCA